jgi:tetraprenyl-beta-curcumene synthase
VSAIEDSGSSASISIPVPGFAHRNGLSYAADFLCSARRYWLGVFPRVAFEVRRWRSLAGDIPDPVLRAMALQTLERKRGNLEGAAAFAALVSGEYRPVVVRALVSCQVICDYLDLLAEQPSRDPVANGYRLHEALIVATSSNEPHREYYLEHSSADDGGYLCALVSSLREALSMLPSAEAISDALGRATERIAVYQSFNHGDAEGSYERFDLWAQRSAAAHEGLRPWESAAAAGSTMSILAMIAEAADPRLQPSVVQDIESAYFPWIGSLHSLLDSLVDYQEDLLLEGRALVGYYQSPGEAAERIHALASEALQRALALPRGRRHALIVAAMASYYLCELDQPHSSHARLVTPAVLEAFGGLATPNMAILAARRSLRRRSQRAPEPELLAAG